MKKTLFLIFLFFAAGCASQELESTRCTKEYCYEGTVTAIPDGETILIDNQPFRIAMVKSPDNGEPGYQEAVDYLTSLCPIGSTVTTYRDKADPTDVFGRTNAAVHCDRVNVNEALLESGHAHIPQHYCGTSSFVHQPWAIKHGCN